MDPHGKFLPPQTDEEFKERAKQVSTDAARSILKTLNARKQATVAAMNEEIKFYERVLQERGEEA